MRWFAGALGLAALACLYVAVSWWAALAASLLAGLVAKRRFKAGSKGLLYSTGWDGGWGLERDGAQQILVLEHVWHGPVWTTLRFFEAVSGEPLYLTVWRREVSSNDWRLLRQLASRGARPLSPSTEAQ
ncbi:hypothetical protein [Pusillimonas sp.]|uniref:hypothetical protein n=1 Tax=Pusillimonas sp. TaxID=3040095 RepID=UPI0037C7DFC1